MAACSSSPTSTSLPAPEPSDTRLTSAAAEPNIVLLEFLNMLRDGDFDTADGLIDEPQLLLLAAVEAGDASLLQGVADGTASLDPQIRENFWSSFVAAVPGLAGPEDFTFSEPEEHDGEGDEFQSIGVTLADGTSLGIWVLRNDPVGGWRIDPIASLGGPFVGSYTHWVESLTPDQRLIAEQAARFYRSSWLVLADRQPGDDPGIAVAESVDEMFQVIGEGN